MTSRRRALVTGAAGFIGSTLVDRLLRDGWSVTGVDSLDPFYSPAAKLENLAGAKEHHDWRFIESDVLALCEGAPGEDSPLRVLLAESDVVFHLAARAGVRSSWGSEFGTYVRDNVLATQVILEAAKGLDLTRFVYASSSSVYGEPPSLPMDESMLCRPHSPYGVTKLAGENLCSLYFRNFGLPAVSLRFFTVYGPRQRPDMAFHRFIRSGLNGEPILLYGDGTQTRDFTYVDDIVDGLVRAADANPGLVANLAGGSRVTVNEVLQVMEDACGRTLSIEHVDTVAGDVRDTWASTQVAEHNLGYAPRVGLEEGIHAEVRWVRGETAPVVHHAVDTEGS